MTKTKNVKKKIREIATKENAKTAIEKANSVSEYLLDNKSLLIVLGGGIVGYLVYRRIQKSADAVADIFKSDDPDHIIPDVSINDSKVTISKEQAKLLAKSLLDAFNHETFFGTRATDEEKVKGVFDKLKTGDDFRLVYTAFGRRKRFAGGTPTHWLDKKISDDYDLIYWLKEEVSEFWDSDLYHQVKARIESAGMLF